MLHIYCSSGGLLLCRGANNHLRLEKCAIGYTNLSNTMSSGTNEENLMRMTKDELQRWIQSEVDRNPQLVQRHKQLAQVEEWVKEKEREATNTRLLYSNACESVLECESVMKGLYGMLGLEYRDEDSDEEGVSKDIQDIIQITDDEEPVEEKTGCDDVNDIVVVDMGAAQETLEPMLEKVTVAMERSSKLVQDLVQMVTNASSNGPESSSVISRRPVQSSPPKENLELTDNSFAIIKTESLSTAVIPSEMSWFSNSHNTDSIKTEPPLTPSEISSLQNNCNDPTTTLSHDCLSIALLKTEPQLMDVIPEFSSPSSNLERLETTAGHDALLPTIKTEPQYMPIMSEIFSLANNTVKTESEQFEMSANQNSDSMATLKTEALFTTIKNAQPQNIPGHSSDSKETTEQQLTSEISSVLSNSEQHKTSNSASKATSEMSLPPSNSEQDNTLSIRKSPSPERQAAKRSKSCNSPVSSPNSETRLRSSTTASSITSSQKETRSSSPVDCFDDPDDIEEPDSHTTYDEPPKSPSVSSTNTSANKTTSMKVTNPSTPATKPAASAHSSSAKKVYTTPSTKSPESSKTHKEIELKVDTVMLGKWKNMAWHRGTVVETQTTENGHRYNVEFKNGKNSQLPAHHVACMKPPMLKDLFVGCRVVVCYKDEQEKICYRAAVLAELPDRKNRMRFLVFYDDGRASYVALPDLHLVCKQLKKVWKDIEDEECRLHVKEYLSVYPNPISVVLRVGQDAKAERDGKFQPCKISQLDGSLIQICFKSDKQKEWLFKGSERLEHIVNIKKRLSQKKSPQVNFVPHRNISVSASTRVTRQSESTATTTPSLSPQNATSSASPIRVTPQTVSPPNVTSSVSSSPVTQQTDTTVSKTSPQSATSAVTQQTNTTIFKVSSVIPQNASSGVTRQTDSTVVEASSVIPQNATSGVMRQTDTTVVEASSVIPQNATSGVTRQTGTAVTKTPSISLEKAMSAAFQPKVVLQKLDMPLSIPLDLTVPKTAVHTVKSVTAVSVLNLRSAKRPAPGEVEDHVSENDQTKSRHMFHRCCPACVDVVRPKHVDIHHGQNPLQIPLLFNFRRMTARRRLDGNVFFHIFYRSPCGRSLCDLQEVQEYLFETHCDFLFLEMFCMDPFVLVNRARPPSTTTSQPYLYLPDISKGKEVLPLPCVNEVDGIPAPTVIYIKDRFLAPGISINTSLDFLTGCDCTDGCRDRTKCSCHRMTIEGTSLCSDGPVDVTAGYTHKRLQTTLPTGVYECNALCRCNPRICCNRLVQHGLQLRLELFMTQHKGWGIRCKDDVAKGTFVCVFTGKIVTEDKVNEDDMVSGNEYLANLDFIEGVEKLKEGYESEAYCSDTEIESNKKTITMKTGPLRKNTIFHDDSSGEEQVEPMQLDTEHEKTDVCDKSVRKKKLSHKPQEKFSQKNVTILTNQERADGPKRCFAMKSFQRRVKALETSGTASENTKKAQLARNTRRLFDGEETCYIIDARQEGNLGRFINHSCSPNLFVQNVFVDTHDLRFPWVAFFTSKRIKAGTELTWDYNYEVGSVEGKVLLCCCGSSRCTGRLL